MTWEQTKDGSKAKSEATGKEYSVKLLDTKYSVSVGKKQISVEGSLLTWDTEKDAQEWCDEFDYNRAK